MLRRRSTLNFMQGSTVVRKRSATATAIDGVPLGKRHAVLIAG